MALSTAHLRVNDPAVQSFLLPGQPVYEEIWKVSRDTKAIAQTITAPVRSGRMRNSIQANRPTRTGPYTNTALVFVKVGYGYWVHEGTAGKGTGYITPKHGRYLAVPKRGHIGSVSGGDLRRQWRRGGKKVFPGGRPYFTTERVRGQKPQPFLKEALHMAMPR